jgi:hypothetical protein
MPVAPTASAVAVEQSSVSAMPGNSWGGGLADPLDDGCRTQPSWRGIIGQHDQIRRRHPTESPAMKTSTQNIIDDAMQPA